MAKRRRSKAKKGGEFEREFCKTLSLWITRDRDDAFWRSASSGGRATIRGRQDETTEGHYGDIVCTGKAGRWFLRVFTVELKRGYKNVPNATVSDCVTSPPDRKGRALNDWIQQARDSMRLAKSKHWMVIHRPDNREAIVYVSRDAYDTLYPVFSTHDGFGTANLPNGNRSPIRVGFFPMSALWKADPKAVRSSFGD